jgi:Divergent InlB B-repeat domain
MEFDLKIIVALAAVVIILGTAGAYFWTVSNKPTHTVTVQIIGNGKVNLGTSGAYTTLIQVVDGQSLGLTALPDQGWSFYSWSGDLTGTTNPINVVVTKDLRIVATFTVS